MNPSHVSVNRDIKGTGKSIWNHAFIAITCTRKYHFFCVTKELIKILLYTISFHVDVRTKTSRARQNLRHCLIVGNATTTMDGFIKGSITKGHFSIVVGYTELSSIEARGIIIKRLWAFYPSSHVYFISF